MKRRIVATLAGFVVGGVVIAGIEWLGHRAFPLPPGIDPQDPVSLAANAALIPAGSMATVVLAWFVGTLSAVAVAARLVPEARRGIAMVLGLLFLAAGVANLVMIPSPVWMWVGGMLAFPLGAAAGLRLVAPSAPAV